MLASGLPAAIGAAVGCPDKTVLLIDGDGSFNMTLNDLGTIMELQVRLRTDAGFLLLVEHLSSWRSDRSADVRRHHCT